MKLLTKAARAAFNARAAAILARFPATTRGSYSHHAMSDEFGRVYLDADTLEHGDRVAGVSCRIADIRQFGEPDDYKHPRRAVAASHGITLPSGKWNLCGYDPETVLDEWERRLERAKVRPPTPEEAAAWKAADDAEESLWAARRAEWEAEKNIETVSS